jgi:CNP1-like family
MNFLQRTMCLALVFGLGTACAQVNNNYVEPPAWEEVPPTSWPSFDVGRLVAFNPGMSTELRFGVDPETVSVGVDQVVRYVMVARSPSGVVNAQYDGINCAKAEAKTYSRWTAGHGGAPGRWNALKEPQWRSLYNEYTTKAAYTLAREAFCDGTSPNGAPAKMVRDLRLGKPLP